MRRWFSVLAMLWALALPAVLVQVQATAAPRASTAAFDGFTGSQLEDHRIPGLALAVIEDGRVGYAAGYGTAGSGRPVTADTPMSIGSVTKAFTAAAILQLREQGLVGLDRSVRSYLPWFQVADRPASDDITVRHLLTHTSGMSEFGYNRVHSPGTSLEAGVRELSRARLTAPVGARYQYFSPNYQVLALIIEQVSGRSYADYVTEHIFRPLRMSRSVADPRGAAAAGMAQGYSTLFGYPVARDHPFREYMMGAGYVVSTARDLGHFLIAMAGDGVFEGRRILQPSSIALMKAPITEVEGVPPGTAMAWGQSRDDGQVWEHAAGADETFNSQLLLHPESGRGVVWLMNRQHLLDPARGQLNEGYGALLLGREPDAGGLSMRALGLIILAVLLLAVAFTIRSFLRLRGWIERSRHLSWVAIAGRIAPHVLIPVVIVIAVYRFLGPLLFGTAWTFNLRYVGLYMLPDITLLLAVAVVPDLVLAMLMTGAVVADRIRGRASAISRPTPTR